MLTLIRLPRRLLTLLRHGTGLLAGGVLVAKWPGARFAAFFLRPFVNLDIGSNPFATQLRLRLEALGSTYIKLGQIMAIRRDLLPEPITEELKNLFDRLPPVPFAQVVAIIENSLGGPLTTFFDRVEEEPIGTASIGQVHLARTLDGERVVLKVHKPGIREPPEAVETVDARKARIDRHRRPAPRTALRPCPVAGPFLQAAAKGQSSSTKRTEKRHHGCHLPDRRCACQYPGWASAALDCFFYRKPSLLLLF